MEKKVIEKFKGFLKGNGVRQLFEGCLRTYGHGIPFEEYVKDCDDPIMAVAHAFEFDKLKSGAIDFKAISKRWETQCVRNRYDAKVNALISEYGEEEVFKTIEEQKEQHKWFMYSIDFLKALEEKSKPKEESKKVIKAHLVSVKPKNTFNPVGADDFEFIKFAKSTNKKFEVDDYTILVKNADKNAYIKFNTHISAIIGEYGLYHMRVRLDKQTGDVHLIFQDSETPDSMLCTQKNHAKTTYYLNSKAVVTWLADRYNLTEEENRLKVTKNLAHQEGLLTIKINQ